MKGFMLLAMLGAAPIMAQGQFTYPGCPDVTEGQFKYVPLVGKSTSTQTKALAIDNALNEPIHMAFDAQPDNKVDIYFTQRDGTIKKFAAAANTVTTIGKIAPTTSGELGLTGITLDPAFKTNGFVYMFYAINNESRLSRFTLTGGQITTATEKRMLTYRRITGAHMGGALAFDTNGDLLITSGNDGTDYPGVYSEGNEGGSSEGSSGNANDLRGAVMRIHPKEDGTYTIPAGNFGEYWAGYFRGKGNTAVADEYANPARVKPELYVKGTRNAYSIAVDPVHHWVAFGSFGINVTTSISEAHYLVNHPSFVGFPYFAGGKGGVEPGTDYYPLWSGEGGANFSSSHPGLTESTSGPMNNSKWNTGPKQLPPVMPGMHSYLRGNVGGGAVTGPFLRYDPASTSPIKFPPNFEGAWSITDWVQNNSVSNPAGGGFRGVIFYKVKSTGDGLVDSLKWFQNYGITGPLDMQQGPDGALYILNYGSTYFGTTAETKIARIEYTGSCKPTSLSRVSAPPGKIRALPSGKGFFVDMEGTYSVVLSDVKGRELARLPAEKGRRAYITSQLVPVGALRGAMTVVIRGSGRAERLVIFND